MESLYFWSWKLEQKKEKKAWINCELRLSDQEKACKSESGGLELSQQRDHSWAQRKNKDLRKTAMPRLRRVDLKLQGCAQPACISFILSWWAISRGSFSFAMAVKSLCSSLFQAPVLAACAAKAWCACQFSFVWWHFHVWRWKKKEKLFQTSPLIAGHHDTNSLSDMFIWSSVLLQPVPDLMNAGLSQERHQASKWGS